MYHREQVRRLKSILLRFLLHSGKKKKIYEFICKQNRLFKEINLAKNKQFKQN